MVIGSQSHYVLLSGRWYTADSLDGKWAYVASGKLPADFADIPASSAKDHVLASIADTKEAHEAVLEAYIPQTAEVKRSQAQVEVTYDGNPEFVEIEDTDLHYAANTASSVIRSGDLYYCCNDGVWFVASDPAGPWEVCDSVPQEIYTIPPSCPVYNVKYVYVYDSTPEVVYVGYTPGYVGSYVYGGTGVYGTGYVYPGWSGTVYYPRPVTWGFAVRYNPYTGNWGFRFGYASGGWFAGGVYRRGWWGSGGYRNVDIDINRNININRSRNNIYNRRRDVARRPVRDRAVADRPRTRPADRTRPAAERPRADRTRPADRRPGTGRPGADRVRPAQRPATRPQQRPNNMYADRKGNVHRRTDKGWQSRDRSGWSRQQQPNRNLQRQHASRQRGTSRTNNYNRSRGSSRPSRGSRGSGGRGGGRGGRGGGGRGGRR